MSTSLKTAKYLIYEKLWLQVEKVTAPFEKEKYEIISNKVFNDLDYIKDRNKFLELRKEGYIPYSLLEFKSKEEEFYENDEKGIRSRICIFKDKEFYTCCEVKPFCTRYNYNYPEYNSAFRYYDTFFTEEEKQRIEFLEKKLSDIEKAYDELYSRMEDCKSFAELASIPEIPNFFDKKNPKKFNRKAKLKENVVNI